MHAQRGRGSDLRRGKKRATQARSGDDRERVPERAGRLRQHGGSGGRATTAVCAGGGYRAGTDGGSRPRREYARGRTAARRSDRAPRNGGAFLLRRRPGGTAVCNPGGRADARGAAAVGGAAGERDRQQRNLPTAVRPALPPPGGVATAL